MKKYATDSSREQQMKKIQTIDILYICSIDNDAVGHRMVARFLVEFRELLVTFNSLSLARSTKTNNELK